MFRSFRQISLGQIFDRVDGSSDDTFGSSDDVALAEVAAATGVPLSDLEIVITAGKPDLTSAIAITPTAIVLTPQDVAAAAVRTTRNSALGTDPVTWAEMDEILTSLGVGA